MSWWRQITEQHPLVFTRTWLWFEMDRETANVKPPLKSQTSILLFTQCLKPVRKQVIIIFLRFDEIVLRVW